MDPFVLTMLSYWWFFHTVSFFWKVWFPIHARQLKIRGHIKYIHMAVVMITLIFSTIPIGVAFGTGGYVIYTLIPGLSSCIARNPDAYFYSFVFPLCILYTIGMTLIVLILWRILRMRLHLSGQVWVHKVSMIVYYYGNNSCKHAGKEFQGRN